MRSGVREGGSGVSEGGSGVSEGGSGGSGVRVGCDMWGRVLMWLAGDTFTAGVKD